MSTPARKRLMQDFKRLQQDPPAGIGGAPHDNNIKLWNAIIFGPDDTPEMETQVIAAATSGVAAEGLSPQEVKVEAEFVAHLSVASVENAIVILMLVEDHLRLQSKIHGASRFGEIPVSSNSFSLSSGSRSNSLGKAV